MEAKTLPTCYSTHLRMSDSSPTLAACLYTINWRVLCVRWVMAVVQRVRNAPASLRGLPLCKVIHVTVGIGAVGPPARGWIEPRSVHIWLQVERAALSPNQIVAHLDVRYEAGISGGVGVNVGAL